jgi:DNA-binding transcriptional LysR family regulator
VELRHLQYFVAIAEQRSFRRAAERVLGFGVDLTAAGEEVLARGLEPRRPLRSLAAVA